MLELIIAVADNGVIGNKNRLPWHLSRDMQHFKKLTLNKNIIMGRRTFESIGKPLPFRKNIVVTRQTLAPQDNLRTIKSLNLAIGLFANSKRNYDATVIGGAEIYKQLLPYCQVLHLTRVHLKPAGDAYFPKFEHLFRLEHSEQCYSDGINFDFETWIRN